MLGEWSGVERGRSEVEVELFYDFYSAASCCDSSSKAV